MRTPTDLEREQLIALMHEYDPVKAREYYLRTRKLKGRKKAKPEQLTVQRTVAKKTDSSERGLGVLSSDPRKGKTRAQISKGARAKQRKELAASIKKLEDRLKKLDALIMKRMREEAAENRKSKAKKERAAKERDKPQSAAEKAEAARENEKYRDKNQQKLKTAAKRDGGSGGGSSEKSSESKNASVSELKSLALKVRGKIAVAKQKLAAL